MVTEVTLCAGEYEAVLVPPGAGLASLKYEGKDLVHPHSPKRRAQGYSGKILLPWPNRIAGARYEFEGVAHQLPINDRATGSALHGLVHSLEWTVIDAPVDSVTFAVALEPTAGYPFRLDATARYSLHPDDGLGLEVITTNRSHESAPFGVGAHPYLTCNGAPLDRCRLTMSANTFLEVDEGLIPVREHSVTNTALDFRAARVVDDLALDHAFGDLPQSWSVTLEDPTGGMAVILDSGAPWVQLFSAEPFNRRCLAVEPMTCPPNAFNSGEDILVLEPGESNVFRLSIRGHQKQSQAV